VAISSPEQGLPRRRKTGAAAPDRSIRDKYRKDMCSGDGEQLQAFLENMTKYLDSTIFVI
jgi:hypothetical protein